MEIIAELKIKGIDPVIMTYEDLQYTVTYGEQSETYDYYDEAEQAFKAFAENALDEYR